MTLQVTSSDDSAFSASQPIIIWRPPVLFVHGLWGHPKAFDELKTALKGNLNGLYAQALNYDQTLSGQISSSQPSYGRFVLNSATFASLGFTFNAANVSAQIRDNIQQFKTTNHAAVVQADVIGHSIGGDVVRTLAKNDFTFESFGRGRVHKLITIGTPHLGSPLAAQLMDTTYGCARNLLALKHNVSFQWVTLNGANTNVSGGVGDLVGSGLGNDNTLSAALQDIQKTDGHNIPTAMIAGQAGSANFAPLTLAPPAIAVRVACLLSHDPLAADFTASGWPKIFPDAKGKDAPNDGMVSVTSQLNGQQSDYTVPGLVHSDGLITLGFRGPSELQVSSGEAAPVFFKVIQLLNAPSSSSCSSGTCNAPFTMLP